MITRRNWVFSTLAVTGQFVFGGRSGRAYDGARLAAFERQLAELEKASGGRLGVAFLDTGSEVRGGHRADERFPMCSTFKLLLAGAVLARVDRHQEDLSRMVHFTREQMVAYSPVTETRVGDRGITVGELCAAAVTQSDNTAANLLLDSIGGPKGLTAFVRSIGDEVTRLDRREPELNEALPGDPRDTTTPAAMVSSLRKLVLGDALSEASRMQLTEWLVQNKTGDKRIRAGLPAGWKVGDKTGTGTRGTANDVAIFWPAGRAPVLLAVYLTGATVDADHQNDLIASVGRGLVGTLQG